MIRHLPLLIALLGCPLLVHADDEKPEKKEPEPADTKPADDPAKTAERIIRNSQQAGKRLGEKDLGKDTRQIQDQIIKDIDALIRKAQEPPPSNISSPQPMGGQGSGAGGGATQPKKNMGESGEMPMPREKTDDNSQPMKKMGEGAQPKENPGGGQQPMKKMGEGAQPKENGNEPQAKPNEGNSRAARRERRQRGEGGQSANNQPASDPMKSTQPPVKNGSEQVFSQLKKADPRSANPRAPDVYKDIWGHLPEKIRQEMDLYYREQFIPRYSELLKQYYEAIAERNRKSGDRE